MKNTTLSAIFIALFSLILSSVSIAGSIVYNFVGGAAATSSSSHDTDCYIGIKALFSELKDPRALIGCRSASIKSNNHVDGFDISIAAKFVNGFDPEKLRLKGFSGNTTTQAEVGGGWDFGKKTPFIGLSGKAPYTTFGIDFLPKDGLDRKNLEPYMQLDTVGKYRKPAESAGAATCQQVGVLPATGFFNPDCTNPTP